MAFLAPEQTGRMNRPVDTRSDLYALGATFYALLSGQPPFTSQEPMQLIADHLAKRPVSLNELSPAIPEAISQVVLKLLAKEPAERYQSAVGLGADLKHCCTCFSAGQEIPVFSLGRHDRVEQLRFSSRLHGREKEMEILSNVLGEVMEGRQRLLLLTGDPGAGKSALGRELRKPVGWFRGRFASGKFDQLRRDRPMVAMIEALSDLLRQRQSDSAEIFTAWQHRVRQELGDDLSMLTQQIPALEILFPGLPPAVESSSIQDATRFRRAVLLLLRTLEMAGRPLVLLLDDIQWADIAFMDLLGEILSDPEMGQLLVVGAYRDGEVTAAHPLRLAITRWEEQQLPLVRMHLAPLPQSAAVAFLAESLARSPKSVTPLATLMWELSSGNPFYLRSLLAECHAQGWLHYGNGVWDWELDRIRDWRVPESVMALLLERISKLPSSSSHLLAVAACLGNTFDLESLAAASGVSTQEVADEAEQLLRIGLWMPVRGERRLARWMEERHREVSYRFAHDRVQEAALASIPPRRKDPFRLELGSKLLRAFPHCATDEHLFLVAESFVGLAPHLLDAQTRCTVAGILLAAGRRAKGAIAFSIALVYLEAGMAVSGREGWQNDFTLAIALRHEASNCAVALTDLDRMERLWTEVTKNTTDIKDLLPVLAGLAPLYVAHFQVAKLKRLGLKVLRLLDLPEVPTRSMTTQQEQAVRQALVTAVASHDAESLASLPACRDMERDTLERALLSIFVGLFFSVPALLFYYVSGAVLRMLKEGERLEDTSWYYTYIGSCLMGSGRPEEIESGRRLGRAAALLLERSPRFKPPVIPDDYMHIVFAGPWLEPWSRVCSRLEDLYPVAVARGDQGCAGFSVGANCFYRLILGGPLADYQKFLEYWMPLLEETGMINLKMEVIEISQPHTLELMGRANSQWRKQQPLPGISGNINSLLYYEAESGKSALLMREYEMALHHSRRAQDLAERMNVHRWYLPLSVTDASLAMAGLLPDSDPVTRRRYLRQLAQYREWLGAWSQLNPANFLHLDRLVSAVWQRVMGHPEKALPLCEEAVANIRAQGEEIWLPYEALSLELAGECLLTLRCDAMAQDMLCRAMRIWSQYGAELLVQEREHHYGFLVKGWNVNSRPKGNLLATVSSMTSDRQDSTLLVDYPSLLQASQSIAAETSFDGVVRRLLLLALANAGAEQARLFLLQNGEPTLACAGEYQSGEVIVHVGSSSDQDRQEPLQDLVHYVARSRDVVVVDDAATDGPWSGVLAGSGSLLCTPLFHTGEVVGILLLEHSRSRGVFTQGRLETVAILGTQAAISLTNARVMEEQKQHMQTIRRLNTHLDQISEAEKRRLASEVHDELGGTLSAAKISLSLLGKRQRDEKDRQRCQEIYQLTDQALRSVRRISHSLRPDVLDRMGLRAALADLATSTRTHSGMNCQLDAEEKEWPLDEAKRTALYRIAQESLTNVVRHAVAKRALITLREEQGVIVLEVSDNGRGIPVERAHNVNSFGLAGMRERAERLGGSVHVAAIVTGGTCVTARIPLAAIEKGLL
ncbi:MAG: AAA family ATPase [Magnetococcus sp. MYC-9]